MTAWGWQPEDRLILTLPLFHVHGLVAGLFGTLTAGASATIFDRFDEASVLAAAASHTMFFGVPTMYHRLAATGRAGELGATAPVRLGLGTPVGRPLAPALPTRASRCWSATA